MKQIVISEIEKNDKIGCELIVEGFDRLETIIILNTILHNEVIEFCIDTNSDREQFINSLQDCINEKRCHYAK